MADEERVNAEENTPACKENEPAAEPATTEETSAPTPADTGSVTEERAEPASPETEDKTEASEAPKTPDETEKPARYAFRWDYRTQHEREAAAEKTVRVRAGLFYGLIVGTVFAVLLALLAIVLLVGQGRPIFLGGGTVSGLTERVVYVNGDGDAEEELACEAAIAKMLPSTVSIIVSNGTLSGVGSGVVLSEDGYIATNHHVIEGKTSIAVRLYGGERYEATLVGSDAVTDLAVLKIEATGLTPATFGDSSELLVGETVMAIGTPTGITYAETATRGIVSCAARAVKIYNASGSLDHTVLMVQTDASVNPGNSGGPLLDRKGEVVGIIANKTVLYDGGNAYFADGMGLAIPANAAKTILNDLIAGREPDRSGFVIKAARLGVGGKNVQAGTEYAVTGVYVTQINGPLFDASEKLAVGDIITEIAGTKVTGIVTILEVLENYTPGATVSVTLYRNGTEMTVDVILGSDDLMASE